MNRGDLTNICNFGLVPYLEVSKVLNPSKENAIHIKKESGNKYLIFYYLKKFKMTLLQMKENQIWILLSSLLELP
jgi:hypothetical protein